MILARCVRRCWDSQKTIRYYIGDVTELPEDHVFLKAATPCFIPIKAEELAAAKIDADSKVAQLAQVVAKQAKEIDDIRRPVKPDELIPEEKRGPGRPPKAKE